MSAPKLNFPPGTSINKTFSRVTIDFFTEQEADDFCDWIQWLDKQESGVELVIQNMKEKGQ